MGDYELVGCGHCGAGVVPSLAATCPFRNEPVCDTCSAQVQQLVATLRARGHDPLAKPRRRGKRTGVEWHTPTLAQAT